MISKWVVLLTTVNIILCSCAINPTREGQRNSREIAILQESKSYDLLEQKLLQLDKEYKKKGNLLGQLFITLDLADFYTYGFINFNKALSYLSVAETLNKKLQGSNTYRGSYPIRGGGKEFYITRGAYTYPRSYDPQKTKQHILQKKSLINSILEGKPPVLVDEKDKRAVFQFETSIAGELVDAVRTSAQYASAQDFDNFKNGLIKTTQGYFDSRHRIAQDEKTFYLHFNIAKVLIRTFDLNRLSKIQVEEILTHVNLSIGARLSIESKATTAYLYFMQALCQACLGQSDNTIAAFDSMERLVVEINQKIKEKQLLIEKKRNKAITKGVLGITAIGASSLIGGSSGVDILVSSTLETVGKMSIAGFVDDMDLIYREYSYVGESHYSREINVLLNMDEQLRLFIALGKIYHRKGEIEKSIFYNTEAVEIINTLRSTISTDKHRISFAAYKDLVYNHLIEDLISSGRHAEAFRYSEAVRSRALVDLLGSRSDLKFKSQEQNELASRVRSFQTYRDYNRLETNLSDDQAKYIDTLYDSAIPTERGLKLVSAQAQKESNTTEQMLDMEQLEIRSLLTVEVLGEENIRKLLPEKSAFVEYYISDKAIFAWVLTAHKLTLQKLPVSSNQLRQMTHDFRQFLQYGTGKYLATAKALYDALFQPLEEFLTVDRIYVVNHRFLHNLPIESLYDGRQFLVEKYLFAYLPSGAMLAYLNPIKKPLESILILADPINQNFDFLLPLKGAKQEAKDIMGFFPISRLLTEQNATESAFKESAIDFNAIHIASHGIFDANNPLQSCIYLSEDANNDGMLTAAELYGVRMSPGLITLSACESGLSKVENGDELIGLLRGLFFAGKSNIVASLWKVDDMSTRFLMSRFYSHLQGKDRVDIMEALHRAKIESLQHSSYSHPFFWSAFVLYGLGM